jgi:polar amino acid transport system permease protein
LPQVVKRILPATGNEVITLVKDTALAQVIGVAELFHAAQSASAREFSTIPIFVAGVFYLAMNWGVSVFFQFAEKKLSYYS